MAGLVRVKDRIVARVRVRVGVRVGARVRVRMASDRRRASRPSRYS